MVLSLSTQGYQSILLSVSMHQNEPVKQSDMLSFSFTLFSSVSRRLNPPPLICFLLSLFLLSPLSLIARVSLCSHLASPPAPAPSFLSTSLRFTVAEMST